MTIDQFVDELASLDVTWEMKCMLSSAIHPTYIRTKSDCQCPVAYIATYKTGNRVGNASYMKAAAALEMSPDDVSLIMRAADNDVALPELRQRLLCACRLEVLAHG